MARTRLPLILGGCAASLQLGAALALTSGDTQALLLASAPSHIFVAAGALALARAYVARRFLAASVGAIANGVALLAFTAASAWAMGPWLLGSALSVGYLAQWLSTVVGIRGVAPLAHGRGTSIRLFVGVTAFTLFSKLQPVAERAVSLSIAEGATSALGFGQKIANGLLLIGMFGLALTTMAALSQLLHAEEWDLAGALLSRTAIASFALTSAVVAVALPLAYPAVIVLFERGEFTASDSKFVSDIVVLQLPWVIAAVLTGVFTSCLYALRWYSRVLLGSAAGLFGMIGTALALAGVLPKLAVAIGGSVGAVVALLVTTALVLRSPVSVSFRATVVLHSTLAIKSLVLLVGSSLVYSGIYLFGFGHQFWPGVVTGALTLIVIVMWVLTSRSTRIQLRDVLASEV